ncbi:cysteine--tRNA ligase [Candidatus Saccharibacteria bacterium]|nr:cysteine--tRNA ligase [Candidatus Saccharibacteria bacterium]
MRLYNTITKQTEHFEPRGDQVMLYSCGPTVYDFAHIGNLRAYVFTDTLRRTLELSGHSVKQVMNITDVGHLSSDGDEGDDKLEKGANREGKSVWEVAKFYEEAFKRDSNLLNILSPNGYTDKKRSDNYARATDFIESQLALIMLLMDKKIAYQTEEAIYFDVSQAPDYEILTKQKIEEKEVAARKEVVTDRNKRHPQDFALWFFTVGRFAGHSMHWDSPWGKGFPGWHLECSAIVHETLGEPLDIHTGGVDHIGTHHTNEIAQTKAAYDKQLSRFWIHNEHLLVNGEKMSKSLGTYYTLDDIIKKGYDPLTLRLLYLQSHYRSHMNFSWESLEAAQNRLKSLRAFADLRFQAQSQNNDSSDMFSLLIQKFIAHLRDDLNTPLAIAALSDLIDNVGQKGLSKQDLGQFEEFLKQLDDGLGLRLLDRDDIPEETKKLILEREAARGSKDWQSADDIRAQLLDLGLELEDKAAGPIWSRLS